MLDLLNPQPQPLITLLLHQHLLAILNMRTRQVILIHLIINSLVPRRINMLLGTGHISITQVTTRILQVLIPIHRIIGRPINLDPLTLNIKGLVVRRQHSQVQVLLLLMHIVNNRLFSNLRYRPSHPRHSPNHIHLLQKVTRPRRSYSGNDRILGRRVLPPLLRPLGNESTFLNPDQTKHKYQPPLLLIQPHPPLLCQHPKRMLLHSAHILGLLCSYPTLIGLFAFCVIRLFSLFCIQLLFSCTLSSHYSAITSVT